MSEPFLAGSLIAGRYHLDRPLGEGGMGTVWAATHTVTRREVAVKFLREVHNPKAELRQRFLREASTASALKHPHVVEILDVFDLEDGTPVMVMELLRGETLASKLTREERLGVEEAAALLLPVMSAVGSAHALGIVHRDLKPANIFLVDEPERIRVKVLDFGIAKLTVEHCLTNIPAIATATGAMLGTPYYMAPEQATGSDLVDHRADVWSLGVILYECLAGSRPIEGENLAQIVSRLMSGAITPLDRLAPDLPPAVSALVDEMLARDVTRRTRDLVEASRVLRDYARHSVPSFGTPASRLDGSQEPLTLRALTSAREPQREAVPKVSVHPAGSADSRAATLLSTPNLTSSLSVRSDEMPLTLTFSKRRLAVGGAIAGALGLGLLLSLLLATPEEPTAPKAHAPSAVLDASPAEPVRAAKVVEPGAPEPPVAEPTPDHPVGVAASLASAPPPRPAAARGVGSRAGVPKEPRAAAVRVGKGAAPDARGAPATSEETLFSGRK